MSSPFRTRLAQFVCGKPRLAKLFPQLCPPVVGLQVSISPTTISSGSDAIITAQGGTPGGNFTAYAIDQKTQVKWQLSPAVTQFDSQGSISTKATIKLANGSYAIFINDLASGQTATGNTFQVTTVMLGAAAGTKGAMTAMAATAATTDTPFVGSRGKSDADVGHGHGEHGGRGEHKELF